MNKQLKIKEVIVVEGRSDTAKLKSMIDCDTLETGGSSLDERTLALIERTAQQRGIIIFTDPDYPGMQIRNKIASRVKNCKHAFVDKNVAIAHGKVGIAEASPEAIIEALENAATFIEGKKTLSWQDFVGLDIIGHQEKRLYVCDYFKLGYGNAKTLFKRLNMIGVTAKELEDCLKEMPL